MHHLPDGSGFFVMEIDTMALPRDPIMWNPWNKVVQDHRDGTIYHDLTNSARAERGLPTPWNASMADAEPFEPPIF
jgi:hypothetical protein